MQIDKLLQDIENDENLTSELINFLVNYEKKFQKDDGYNIREEITGPIVDRLYKNTNKVFISELEDNIKFKFTYKSKIMRDYILRYQNPADHFWEPQTTRLLKLLSQNADNVFVGGAYIGDQVVYIGKELLKNGGKCYTFEPNTDSYNLLKENCELNNLDNIVFNNKGLWYENKRLVFVGDDSHASSQELENDSENGFDAVSINNYCEENNIKSVDLIMLDLEGGELNVLKGASNYLNLDKDNAPTIIFEIHSSYVDWSNGLEKTDIGSYLIENGYTLYSIRDFQSNYPMKDRKIELIPASSTILDGPSHGFNMIALKDNTILNHEEVSICENVSPKLLLHRDKSLHFPIN